jgi:hypothetical protein
MEFKASPTTPVETGPLLVEQEIRGFTVQTPQGLQDGYQWRLLLRDHLGAETWSPWMYAPNRTVELMLAQWASFLNADGHLATQQPPGTPRH